MSKYFVVVPVYNEQRQIRRCIKHIKRYAKNIVVVNDGSTDNTAKLLSRFRSVHVITLKQNRGKGFAMKIGAQFAWKKKATGVIFMDGDNQHHPKHLPAFTLLLKKNDMVIGIRRLRANIPIHRKIGNLLMVYIMQFLFGLHITDMMCGFRAFTRKGLRKLNWKSERYGVETEMLTIIGKKRIKFQTLVVDTIYHDKYKGFSFVDGIRILLSLPRWKWGLK
jgi:glycosyltransferase involved in cell wall biosynthesis